MIRNLFGGSKCRTIDVCDIFGDGSGKALYRLDGNANDESGNYHGTETDITYGGGVYERGAVFNGTSSFIETNYTPTTSGATTYSFWINASTLTENYSMLSSSGASGINGTDILITGGKVSARIYTSATVIALTGTTSVNNNQWFHVVFVVSGTTDTNSYKLYINNVVDAQGTATLTTWNNSTTLKIGKRGTLSSYFTGSIDQVRIFNRAITASEVAILYNECAPTSTVDNINPFEDGSLKALYQFNGDATDKTGVYNGTATNVTYGTGKFGQCAVFNGTSSNVSTALKMSNTAYSISVWVNTSNSTSYMGIVAAGFNNTDKGFLLERSNVNKVTFYIVNGTNAYGYTSTATLQLSQWVHIIMSWDGTTSAGGIRLYFNGNLDSSFTAAVTNASIGTWTEFIKVGVEKTSNYFNGSIDQVRIFNKALTPMEVASLYNETTPLEEPMHSLVDPFKDGSGKALYRLDGNALDESGNYNGTATSVTYGAGRFGRCGVFNGSSSYITKVVDSSIKAVSMWINAPLLTSISGDYILAMTDGSYIAINGFTGSSSTETIMLYSASENSLCTVSIEINDNSWKHIYVGFNAVGDYSIYVNGVSRTVSYYGNPTYVALTNKLDEITTIGAKTSDMTYAYSGSIDQLRFFNRALTASEVTALYNEI